MSVFKDAGHLLRFAGLSSSPFWCFWWYEATWSPKALASMGTIAGNAIGEIAGASDSIRGTPGLRDLPRGRSGREEERQHAHVNCEACHGALAKHRRRPFDGQACSAGHGRTLCPLP